MAGKTSTTTLSASYQNYFNRRLLTYAVQALGFPNLGLKAPLPRNAGHKALTWFRFGAPATTDIKTATEGDPSDILPANSRQLSLATVTGTLVQYTQSITLTDILNNTSLFNVLMQATKTMGEDFALHYEELVRTEMGTATTKMYADDAANYAGLANDYITHGDIVDICTKLQINRAPLRNGNYFAVVGPQVLSDIMRGTTNFPEWVDAAKYSAIRKLETAEVGMWMGVRFILTTVPWRSNVEGTYAAAGSVYGSFFMGDEAFGVPDLAGESPYSPHMYVSNQADKYDPANQYVTIAAKTYWDQEILNDNYLVFLESNTAYAG